MAEDEIRIIINAVDNMSATIDKIEKNLNKANQNILKQTKVTSKGFTEQTGNLLVLGQAAASVDRIFSSYQNMQLRIENATERVTGAQDRLAEAQYELNKVIDSGTASLEDIEQAQRKVDSASRGLTIAQNNLERANNAVVGSYINMGMQSVTLIASYNKIKDAIVALGTTSTVALGAVGIAVGALLIAYSKYNEASEKVKEKTNELNDAEKDLLIIQKDLVDETDNWVGALKEVNDFIRGFVVPQSEKEAKSLINIKDLEHELNLAKLSGDEEEIESARNKLDEATLLHQIEYTDKREKGEAWLVWKNIAEAKELGINKETTTLTEDFYKTSYDNIITYLDKIYYPKLKELHDKSIVEEIRAEKEKVDEIIRINDERLKAEESRKNYMSLLGLRETKDIVGDIVGAFSGSSKEQKAAESSIKSTITEADRLESVRTGKAASNGIIYLNDFVIKPNANDVIVGTKGGKGIGTTINIYGDNYGVDADEIAEALATKIGNTIKL